MPPTNLFGLGYGVGPAGYGYPSVGRWSPLSLGSSLAAWYKADAGCYTDAACLFASASSQYLSKTSPTFAPTTKMTIAASWKPTSVGDDMAIAGRYVGLDEGWMFIQRSDGKVSFQMFSAGIGYEAVTSVALSAGVQYRLVLVYDGTLASGSRAKIYIDGVDRTASDNVISAIVETTDVTLGIGAFPGIGYVANGALARLGFSSLALSGAALTAAHTSTFWADMTAARQADWFSFYNLCEASGTRVDSTGLNNLTPTNGPTVAAGPGEGLAVNNSPVKRWEDQSGLGLHATQATIASQPLWIASWSNGKPCVRFDGTNDELATASVATASIDFLLAGVMAWIAGVATRPFMNGSGGYGFQFDAINKREIIYAGVKDLRDGNLTTSIETWLVNRVDATPLTTFRLNGASEAINDGDAIPATPATATYIGSSGGALYANVDFGEIVLASASKGLGVQQSLESYTRSRFGHY